MKFREISIFKPKNLELEDTFLEEYSFTTSHKTRNDHDMIYQFTYVNYLREKTNDDGSLKVCNEAIFGFVYGVC